MYYHASQVEGICCLEPRVSNHGTPRVYFSSKRENVLVYLSNSIEKFCKESGFRHTGKWTKWGPYGFTKGGLLELQEYYPNALEETYSGVSAYIYAAGAEGGFNELEGIRDAYFSERPVPVLDCEYIPDAYAEILRAHAAGKIAIRRYEELTPAWLQWVRDTMIQEYRNNPDEGDYRYFLRHKFPFLRDICE